MVRGCTTPKPTDSPDSVRSLDHILENVKKANLDEGLPEWKSVLISQRVPRQRSAPPFVRTKRTFPLNSFGVIFNIKPDRAKLPPPAPHVRPIRDRPPSLERQIHERTVPQWLRSEWWMTVISPRVPGAQVLPARSVASSDHACESSELEEALAAMETAAATPVEADGDVPTAPPPPRVRAAQRARLS